MTRTRGTPSTSHAGHWGFWWAAVSVWWTLDGVTAAGSYIRMARKAGEPATWGHALSTGMPSALMWIPPTMLALWTARRFPLDRHSWRRLAPVHAAILVAVVVARAAAVVALNPWIGWYDVLPPFREVVVTSFANNTFLYLILVGFGHALVYAGRARDREEQLASAELSALKMQLHPHFLFNTLNAITAFVRTEPLVAERMIARLSELLRHTLQHAGVHEVALEDELRFLRSYLEIEQARFDERLRVRWDIDPAVIRARVPHLILQPLVENAIRHGIGPRAAGGRVEIEARRRGVRLELVVRDRGVGMDPGTARTGVGLSNTRARLRQLYGAQHTIEVQGAPGRGVEIRITLPLRATDEEDDMPGGDHGAVRVTAPEAEMMAGVLSGAAAYDEEAR
ncbi:sensor histidine kinase [Longimicrobium terrae]|uniref:histidine kinase n=1 Tax=Longimicrobium terrae TaxID=1639882 RepID=A0A841H7R9_9BACT|nr:histidine kinase [Longimicrobium terrae]MBB4639514.1 signal transduction histidine kinase [Longimicrobium terrae]MBB6073886.1 signal transduction histidine kinase [Longimicrobium terrae]NNC32496.1 histidine kinase [Longimicrobium terrae]